MERGREGGREGRRGKEGWSIGGNKVKRLT